ncbi:hypothetical protein UFOVP255_49 [uncultured Caudovirales phage]|uniref:Peptidase A1 domain-containing protein n=1 Tax=uncultured Caudovirales phage TaxID=2100421 RepID=A0A6J5LI91_9CAUD|nr:hypothetical protein UFOVP255_49 [uncultured Caudovirales phage]
MSQAGIVSIAGSGSTVVETLTGNSGGAVGPTSSNINVLGSGNLTVVGTPGTSTLTISDTSSVLTWASTASTTISAVAGNGYILSAASLVTITMPTSQAVGTLIGIALANTSGSFTIVYGTGQHIRMGSGVTTTTSGSLSSNADGDTVTLLCTTAATASAGTWHVISGVGNLTVA